MPALPSHDQKILATPLGKQPGGTGGNVACAASRLGLNTGMVSWVGDDADHELVLNDLRRFGVDTTHVVVEPNTLTNYTTVLIDPSGEKAIVIVPTAFNVLTLTPLLNTYLSSARLVYATAYDPDQLARVANVVHAAGGLVSTDIEPVAGLQPEALARLLPQVDLAFVDADAIPAGDQEAAARELQAGGPALVVMSFGARGSLACTAQGITRCPAFRVPVVDTTGAGDCFTGAFLAGYLRQWPLAQTLRYANAAAALSIQAVGARAALPTHRQVEEFLASQ